MWGRLGSPFHHCCWWCCCCRDWACTGCWWGVPKGMPSKSNPWTNWCWWLGHNFLAPVSTSASNVGRSSQLCAGAPSNDLSRGTAAVKQHKIEALRRVNLNTQHTIKKLRGNLTCFKLREVKYHLCSTKTAFLRPIRFAAPLLFEEIHY